MQSYFSGTRLKIGLNITKKVNSFICIRRASYLTFLNCFSKPVYVQHFSHVTVTSSAFFIRKPRRVASVTSVDLAVLEFF